AERRVEGGFADFFAAGRRIVQCEKRVRGLRRRRWRVLEQIDELQEHRGGDRGTRVEPGLELRPRYAEQDLQLLLAANQRDGLVNEERMLGARHDAPATLHLRSRQSRRVCSFAVQRRAFPDFSSGSLPARGAAAQPPNPSATRTSTTLGAPLANASRSAGAMSCGSVTRRAARPNDAASDTKSMSGSRR